MIRLYPAASEPGAARSILARSCFRRPILPFRLRSNALALILVATLHLLLLLWLELVFQAREAPRPAASRLRLIPLLPRQPVHAAMRADARPALRPPRGAAPESVPDAERPGVSNRAPVPEPAAPAPAAGVASVEPGHSIAPAPPGTASAPLNLQLPLTMARRAETTPAAQPTLAEQVASDPRSHSPRLTYSEKFAITLGTLECIFEERLPDGSIYRAPGHRVAKATSIVAATGKQATGRGGDTVTVCEK